MRCSQSPQGPSAPCVSPNDVRRYFGAVQLLQGCQLSTLVISVKSEEELTKERVESRERSGGEKRLKIEEIEYYA